MKYQSKASDRLAKYMRDARINAGLTQAELADRLGYESAQYVSDWERGVSKPPLKNIRAMVKFLHLDGKTLFKLFVKEAQERVSFDLTREFARVK